MAVDFADIDRDGRVDIFVADMLSRDSRRRKTQTPTHTPLPKLVGHIDDRPQMQRNTLFWNRGDGTFAQIAGLAGVEASDWTWAAMFLDVDLDGYEDLLVTTGSQWDVMDSDTWDHIRSGVTGVSWRRELSLFPPLRLKNRAFRNDGDRTFTEVSDRWGFSREDAISHGMAAADLDGDGDLDVVVNRLGTTPGVFRNDASAPRIAVRLLGRPPNTEGVGATITIRGGAVPVQTKEVTLGGMYLSSSDPEYAFATGRADSVELEVRWRNGRRTIVPLARPNRAYEVREPDDSAKPIARRAPLSDRPFFSDASGLLRHHHVDAPFDDFARQPLLPNQLSLLGPGVTWYDVDGDGREDLLISSGRGGTLGYFRNDGGHFTPVDLHLGPAPLDQTAVLAVPGAAGRTVLLVGQSSYEARTLSEALAVPGALEIALGASAQGTHATAAIPADSGSVGPLALGDYDGDGNLDLFVGGRVAPGAYPLPVSSRLFHNLGDGRFVLDTLNSRLLADIGMVSAAVFSDLNGDGWPDLLVAPEWGALRLFINHHGRFEEAPASAGPADYRSRWNGVTTGDLDGDGRLDIVATSWGDNTSFHPSVQHPVQLYYGPFGSGGAVDLITAQFDERLNAVAPLEPFSRVSLAIPDARLRLRTFAAYADASLDQVLGVRARRAQHLEVTTLQHMLFLNRGGTFIATPLPTEAQFAPAFYAGVADFDGDGREDVFLSQNFYPTEIGTPRNDAGRGLWLRGDGAGGLIPVPGQESGILVYGDQRGAAFADYDGDGRIDLVVTQNGGDTKLYHNERARPGLRVRLVGPPGNPHAIGATIRVEYQTGWGPAREVHGGSGYWSQDGLVQVMGLAREPAKVWVRWPGGTETEVPVPPNSREITIRQISGSPTNR